MVCVEGGGKGWSVGWAEGEDNNYEGCVREGGRWYVG